MSLPPRLPRPVSWLLRLSPVSAEARDDVQADLHELFVGRRSRRGALHAHWRAYHDVASLWFAAGTSAQSPALISPSAFLRGVRGDLRYAVRMFARQPGILLLTILALSLGLGVATAAFSIMNVAALRGEGLVDSGRAPGVLRTTDASESTVWRYDEFLHLREGATHMRVEAVLTDTAIVQTIAGEGITGGEEAPSAGVAFVSGGFFGGTGGRVVAGRPLEMADERQPGAPPVVVSFGFWTSRLGRDPDIVGRTIRVGRTEATIVGVAERGFSVPANRPLWMPLSAYGVVYGGAVKGTPDVGVQVFGRLLPDVHLSEAEAQLGGVAATLPRGPGAAGDSAVRVRLDPNVGLGRSSSPETLVITVAVFAVIALVLLLACANVATVLISTAITREREMGVRAALGASRWRIVRQLITESLALGAIAAAVGLLVAHWAIPLIGTMIEAPAHADLAPDLTVYLFLGLVTLATGVAAGLAPAWHSRGADLVTPLKGEARHNRLAPRRLRSLLVMTQAAVSVVLIVMATLFVRATFHSATIDVGFDPAGLYVVSAGLGDPYGADGPSIKDFWARADAELRGAPGIVATSLAELTPFGGATRTSLPRNAPGRVVNFNRTGSRYFETIGLSTLTGRTYSRAEVATRAPVAVVSESLARAYWPDRSPLGESLPEEIPVPALDTSRVRPVVIGVVADAVTDRLHERNGFAIYEPLDPASEKFGHLMIRAAPGTTGVIDQARGRLRAIAPEADIKMISVATVVRQEADRPRTLAILSGVVGVIAIVLCVTGLYGLTASVVGQRAREMGIRVAMGAEPRDLLRLMMQDSLEPVMLGLVLGAGAALLASRIVVSAMLFGVSPQDPLAFGGAAAILLGAAMLAVLVPIRRAAAIDAAAILRRS